MKSNARLVRSFLAHSFGTLVTIFDRLLLVPVIFNVLSPLQANTWLVLRTIPAYLSASDIGLASEAGNRMTSLVRDKNYSDARVVYSTSWLFISLFGSLMFLVLNAWIYFYGLSWLTSLFETSIFNAWIILAAVGGYALMINQTQLINATFRSHSLDYYGVTLTHTVRVFEILFFIVLVYLFKNLVSIALGYFLARFFGNIFLFLTIRKKIKNIYFEKAKVSLREIKAMIKPALGFAAIPISAGVMQQAPVSLLAIYVGVTTAGAYAAVQIFSRIITQFGLQLSRTFWAEMSTLKRDDLQDREMFWKLHDRAVGISIICSFIFGAIAVIFGPIFLKYWAAGNLSISATLILLLVIGAFANSIWMTSYAADLSQSEHGTVAKKYIISSIAILIIINVWIMIFGLSNNGALIMAAVFALYELTLLLVIFFRMASLRNQSLNSIFISIYKQGFVSLLLIKNKIIK